MPEESIKENKLPGSKEGSGLTPDQTAKADRIYKMANPGRVRAVNPELTTQDVLSEMSDAFSKAMEKGDLNKANAIKRNLEALKKGRGL